MNILLRLPTYVKTERVLLPGARRTVSTAARLHGCKGAPQCLFAHLVTGDEPSWNIRARVAIPEEVAVLSPVSSTLARGCSIQHYFWQALRSRGPPGQISQRTTCAPISTRRLFLPGSTTDSSRNARMTIRLGRVASCPRRAMRISASISASKRDP